MFTTGVLLVLTHCHITCRFSFSHHVPQCVPVGNEHHWIQPIHGTWDDSQPLKSAWQSYVLYQIPPKRNPGGMYWDVLSLFIFGSQKIGTQYYWPIMTYIYMYMYTYNYIHICIHDIVILNTNIWGLPPYWIPVVGCVFLIFPSHIPIRPLNSNKIPQHLIFPLSSHRIP